MPKQVINVGTAPNAGNGDTIRAAGQKINSNFTELYNVTGASEPPLGNPSQNGYILSSSTAGVRTWVAPSSGGGLSALPNSGHFEDLTVNRFTVSGVLDASSATTIIGNMNYSAALSTNDSYNGVSIEGLNAGTGITQWNVVYLGGGGKWLVADANGSGTYPARGLAIESGSNNTPLTVLVHGTVRHDAWSWTPGQTVYLGETAGAVTQTQPTGAGSAVQQLGYALTTDIAYFDFGSNEHIILE